MIVEDKNVYDVIVIGAGASGLTTALYASRSGLKTLVLERGMSGGQLLNTHLVENYTGTGVVSGSDLADKMEEDAFRFGADKHYGDVLEVSLEEGTQYKFVHTRKQVYKAKAIVIGTGTTNKKLGVIGEEEFSGRGVSYCAVCDGAFFKNQELVVIGGGDSAVEEGVYLTQFADKVTIIHRRGTLRAQKILQDRFLENPKTDIIWDAELVEIHGKDAVKAVSYLDKTDNKVKAFDTGGVFVYIGLIPNTGMFKSLGLTNAEGFIPTNNRMETKIKGIYATGDVRDTPLRQISTAVGDGAVAGNEVFKYIQEEF